jgi:hypothetical protein
MRALPRHCSLRFGMNGWKSLNPMGALFGK